MAEVQQLACSCFRLNSLQMAALLSQEMIPKNIVDTAVRMAESVADELTRADGREVIPFVAYSLSYIFFQPITLLLSGVFGRVAGLATWSAHTRRWIQFGRRPWHSSRPRWLCEPFTSGRYVPTGSAANKHWPMDRLYAPIQCKQFEALQMLQLFTEFCFLFQK